MAKIGLNAVYYIEEANMRIANISKGFLGRHAT